VNDQELRAEDEIVSNASCTTNCLAPLCKVLDEAFGIQSGHMTTIHAATSDQSVVDKAHRDPRRARGTIGNIIPTSTGASKALKEVLPHLGGLISGISYRVPTADVSMVDLTITTRNKFVLPQAQAVLRRGAESMPGIFAVEEGELVSSDFTTNPASCTVDMPLLSMVGEQQLHVSAWYDNEWGFSNRMVDTALAMMKAA
jgi:glyceraldehyde 3-phosphate dehydrogenase